MSSSTSLYSIGIPSTEFSSGRDRCSFQRGWWHSGTLCFVLNDMHYRKTGVCKLWKSPPQLAGRVPARRWRWSPLPAAGWPPAGAINCYRHGSRPRVGFPAGVAAAAAAGARTTLACCGRPRVCYCYDDMTCLKNIPVTIKKIKQPPPVSSEIYTRSVDLRPNARRIFDAITRLRTSQLA